MPTSRLALFVLGACAASVAGDTSQFSSEADVRALSVDSVQELLTEWGLDSVFGESFRRNHINGEFLLEVRPTSVDETTFAPNAQKLHWTVLFRYVDELRDSLATSSVSVDASGATGSGKSNPRRSLFGVGEGYSGVNLRRDKSAISFGVEGDVAIRRVGEGELEVTGDLLAQKVTAEAHVNVTGDIILNGQSLTELLEDLKAQVDVDPSTQTYGSCSEMYLAFKGNIADGDYTINVDGTDVDVYCDMKNGGWTRVINVLSSTSQTSYINTAAVNGDSTSAEEFYKLSDEQINTIAASAGSTDYLYVCGDEVEFVTRTTDNGAWTSLQNQGGWIVDRNVDGRYDCTADRPNYIFADYTVDGYSGEPLHDDEDCDAGIHTNFGESSTNTGCYMSNGNGWAEPASVWVGGQFAFNRAVTNCVTDGLSCEYSTHFDGIYDTITR